MGICVNAQCLSFARQVAKPKLAPYTHDGNFNAAIMEEGESATINKTFFSGQEYRLVLATVDALPKNIRIRVVNQQRQIIFDNADHNYVYVWDFIAESTESLIINVKIPEDETSDKIIGGCIAIMFGFKVAERQQRRRN
jgi:hypothetical protein